MPTAPQCRIDRAALRPPRRLSSGTVVYQAVLVYADRPLQYGWGTEIPTEQALRDPAYLEGLIGSPVVVMHPTEGEISPESGPADIAGTVCGAVWDPVERCVIVDLAVHTTEGQTAVEQWRQLSEGYRAEVVDGEQTARIPNHTAIVPAGRAPGNEIRADQTGVSPMTEEQIKTLIDSAIAPLVKRLDAAESEEEPKRDEEGEEVAAAPDLSEEVKQTVIKLVGLMKQAEALGLEVPPDVFDPAELQKLLAIGAGADKEKAALPGYSDAYLDACMAKMDKAPAEQAEEPPVSMDAEPAPAKDEPAPRGDSLSQFIRSVRRDSADNAPKTRPGLTF